MRKLLFVLIAAAPLVALAQSQERPKPKGTEVIDTVPSPSKVKAGEPLLDNVITRKSGGETIQEYRIKGKLYKQRVQPESGPAYYLVDEKGEGKWTRVDGPDTKISVPMWVVAEW
jgi:Protein of unknown function (DUF2782)